MTNKPAYEELEQRIIELEKEIAESKRAEKAEEALREIEYRYKTLIEGPLFAMIIHDVAPYFVTKKAAELFGYNSPEDLTNSIKDIEKLFKEEYRANMKERRVRRYETKETSIVELVGLRKDGTEIPLLTGINVIDWKGEPAIQCTYYDITEHKHTEDALRESEERFRNTFEQAAVGIAHVLPDGHFVRINQRFCDIVGYTQEEMLEHTFQDITYKDDLETDLDYVSQVLRDELKTYSMEKRYHKKDGSIIWVNLTVSLVRDSSGEPKYFISVIEDITERKQAEQELKESEEKYRHLFELESDAIMALRKRDGQILEINKAGTLLYGYAREELLNLKVMDISTEPEDTRKAVLEDIEKIPIRYHRKKDGAVFPVEISASSLSWKGEEARIATIRDISDRIEAENEKAEFEAQLQQAYRMEAIGTLAGGIAHDFNNILSAIIGFSEIAISDVERGTSVQKSLSEVLKAGDRAKNLVSQILTFSRQTEHESKPVQVKSITNEALKLLRASLPATIEIRNYLQSQSVVMADPTQIHQIVMNLCTNASHAMHQEGGSLEVRLDDVKLAKEAAAMHPELASGSNIKLTVSDTCQGMEPHVLERIFDPFFTTKEKGEGTGMGLSVVHGIVKSGGGSIFVRSEPGKGTCFEILFPIIETVPALDPTVEEPIPTGAGRVLFIDDEKAITDLTRRQLESLGYEVTTRTSPIEALELFELQPDRFDIVITDMTMPQMTGKELSENLLRIKPSIPIILCTGFSANIDEDRAASMGIKAMIFKPILKRDIAQTIRKVLDPALSKR